MTEVMEGELDVYFTFELVPVSGMNILKTISYSLYKAQKADNSWLDVNTRYQYVVKRGEFGQTYGTSLKLSLVIKLMPVEIYGSATAAAATTTTAASAACAAATASTRSTTTRTCPTSSGTCTSIPSMEQRKKSRICWRQPIISR